jgi:uncharacterized phage protein (TIGR01671 family)
MREIKFRIWSVELKKFILLELPVLSCCAEGFLGEVIGADDEEPEKGVELQQYTGLKDKNKKEIYEGDIVKSIEGGWLYQIQFLPYGGFQLKTNDGWPKEIKNASNYEVIGNIYENPELLKEQPHEAG